MSQRRMRKPRRTRKKEGRSGLWPLLGLGAVAAGFLLLGRRQPRSMPSPAPQRLPSVPSLELPLDAELAWIPGPSGSLRVCERHRRARKTVLFIHGLGGRLEQWAPLLDALGPGLRGVALDLPGHGESDAPSDEDYSIHRLSEAVGAVVASLDMRLNRPGVQSHPAEPVILVAHGLGASIALEYAAMRPERVAGLLLVDPSGDQTGLTAEDLESFLGPLRQNPKQETAWFFRQLLIGSRLEIAEKVLGSLEETPSGALLAYLEGASAHSPIAALERVNGPVLNVISEWNDSPESLHRLMPMLRTRRIFGTSQWLMMERPDEIQEALWELLDEVPSNASRRN